MAVRNLIQNYSVNATNIPKINSSKLPVKDRICQFDFELMGPIARKQLTSLLNRMFITKRYEMYVPEINKLILDQEKSSRRK